MRPKPKPVYLVDKPSARPAGKLDLTPTDSEKRWIRIYWRWFGWGGLAVWASLGWVYNQATEHASGSVTFLLTVGLGGLALLLTAVMAGIGATMAERAAS
jgi:hypothetical protein